MIKKQGLCEHDTGAYRLKPVKRITVGTLWMSRENAVFSDCLSILFCTYCRPRAGVLSFVKASPIFKHKHL